MARKMTPGPQSTNSQWTNLPILAPDPNIEPHKELPMPSGGSVMAPALNLRTVSGYGIVLLAGFKDAGHTRAYLECLRAWSDP